MNNSQILSWLSQQTKPMTDTLIQWSEINSSTFNTAGLSRMANVLTQAFSVLDADIELIKLLPYSQINDQGQWGERTLGNLLRIRKRPQAPHQVLLCGHMDTVYTEDHPFQTCQWVDKNTLNGPGVADMKGGLLVMLYALQALEQSSSASQLGWEVLINPDEEIGSISSSASLTAAAKQHQLGLVFEPSLSPEGLFAGQRKGSGKFTLVVKGRSAHVGRAFHEGHNAIVGLAKLITEIHQLNEQRRDMSVNVGYCHGGGAVNVVPDLALCHIDVRTTSQEDELWLMQTITQMLDKFNQRETTQAEWHGRFTRPPKKIEGKALALYEWVAKTALELKLKVEWQATGGCCDGNNLAAAGLPNIDTLGVRGGAIHSPQEFVLIDSLVERAQLSAFLLMNVVEGKSPC